MTKNVLLLALLDQAEERNMTTVFILRFWGRMSNICIVALV